MKYIITIRATAEIDLSEDELPEDVGSVEEAIDAILDELPGIKTVIDLGDYGEAEFDILTASIVPAP